MRENASSLVRKLWQYCNVLRDDGLSYPDYVEQLTYLLFLKLSDELENGPVPAEYAWRSFSGLDTEGMYRHYGDVLTGLGSRGGMLGLVFGNARNKIRDPGKLRLLMTDFIGQTEWSGLSQDVKGDVYEGLLDKNARDTKSGAGQYFTPRPLIDAIVDCVDPKSGEVVCDPACGTGGFLLSAQAHMEASGSRPSNDGGHRGGVDVRGVELVVEVARLAAMNLLLHGVYEAEEAEIPISCRDSLRSECPEKVDVVVTNPPFGTRGSVTYATDGRAGEVAELTVIRPDFWVATANKQLNFLQHVYTLLKPQGRAAIVVPDNVLFESGAAATIRRRLLENCDVHTLLRLPAGLFYASGVKANVLFFERLSGRDSDKAFGSIWVYDIRSSRRFSLKTNPIVRADLQEFVELYRSDRHKSDEDPLGGMSGRWRKFDQESIRDSEECSLDIAWREESEEAKRVGVDRLDELSRLIAEDLRRALDQVQAASSARRGSE